MYIIQKQIDLFSMFTEKRYAIDLKKLDMVAIIAEYHVRRHSLDLDVYLDVIRLSIILTESKLIFGLCL